MIKLKASISWLLPTLFLFFLFVLSCQKSYSENEIFRAIEKGNVLIKTIEAYHKKEGRYPFKLKDLVPKYIAEIPLTDIKSGKEVEEFYYRLIQGKPNEYELFFFVDTLSLGAKSAKICTYNPSEKYPSSENVKTERLIKNWAIQTQFRNYGSK